MQEIVLDQQELGSSLKHRRLMPLDPQDLGCGPCGDKLYLASDLVSVPVVEFAAEVASFLLGAIVEPYDRTTKWLAILVHQNERFSLCRGSQCSNPGRVCR